MMSELKKHPKTTLTKPIGNKILSDIMLHSAAFIGQGGVIMFDKQTYINQVQNQLNEWNEEVRKLSAKAGSSGYDAIEDINRARHLVENKLNELRITGDEVLGHWETEIDSLRHQVQNTLDSARRSFS